MLRFVEARAAHAIGRGAVAVRWRLLRLVVAADACAGAQGRPQSAILAGAPLAGAGGVSRRAARRRTSHLFDATGVLEGVNHPGTRCVEPFARGHGRRENFSQGDRGDDSTISDAKLEEVFGPFFSRSRTGCAANFQ